MKLVTFNCGLCGKETSQKTCWYKKREHHYCSKICANRANAQKKATGLTRKEYEKQYWSLPENRARRKVMSRENHAKRMAQMGRSLRILMLHRAKARAEAGGLGFDLTVDDFDIPDLCPILGIKFEIGKRSGGHSASPSLDKIIPALGYVRGNVQVISKRANMIKCDATLEELIKVAQWASSYLPSDRTGLGLQ